MARTPNSELIRGNMHPFPRHPILSGKMGARLAEAEHDRIVEAIAKHGKALGRLGVTGRVTTKRGAQDPHSVMMGLRSSYDNMKAMEMGHEAELKKIAIDVVAKAHGVDPIQIESILSRDSGITNDAGVADFTVPRADEEILEQHRRTVNKRHTHNALIQGAGINHMNKAMVLAKERLDGINPKLHDEASYFANGASLGHFYTPYNQLGAGEFPLEGSGHISWDDEGPRIHARAKCFPALVQELSKAVSELNMAHGLPQQGEMSEREARGILEHTDHIRHEPWHFMMGPALEKEVMTALSRNNAMMVENGKPSTPYTRTLLSLLPEEDLHADLHDILSGNEMTRGLAAGNLKRHMLEAEERKLR